MAGHSLWDLAGGDGGWQLRQHGGDSGPETEVQSKDEEDAAQAGTWPGRSESPPSKLIVIQYGATPPSMPGNINADKTISYVYPLIGTPFFVLVGFSPFFPLISVNLVPWQPSLTLCSTHVTATRRAIIAVSSWYNHCVLLTGPALLTVGMFEQSV